MIIDAAPAALHRRAEPVHQLSPVRMLRLFLLPGVLVSAGAVLGAPLAGVVGLPAVAAVFAAILLILVPVELGYLRRRARIEADGRIRTLLAPANPPRTGKLALVIVGVLAVQAAFYAVLWGPIEEVTRSVFFDWLPGVFFAADRQDPQDFTAAALIVTLVLGVVANGVVAPIVEELYFRGYLLPRMARLGRWAPVANAFLFSAYHLFAPWQLISRFLFALPFVAAVWRTRSVALGIVVHVANNLTSMVLLYLAYRAAL